MSFTNQIESLFNPDSYHLGKKTVVTTKVEHESATKEYKGFPNIHRLAVDREPQFVMDASRDRITFNIKIQDSIQDGEGVVTTPRTIQSLPADIPAESANPELVISTDYQGLNQESILLVDDYNLPKTTIQPSEGSTETLIIQTEKSGANTVGPRTEASLRLPRQEITVEVTTNGEIESKVIEVIPKLQLQNWGELDMYGSDEGRVLPTNTNNDFADRYTQSARDSDKVSINKSEELMFIPETEHTE